MAGRDPKQEAAGPSEQKHVSSAMVEAWCKAAKANASPGAMHKLLQVLLTNPLVIATLLISPGDGYTACANLPRLMPLQPPCTSC